MALPGESLSGSEPAEVSFGLSAFSEVSPEASPVGPEARATGHVVLGSLIPLPSGTVISASVEESFESFEEGELRPEPFSQEILLYRYPLRPDEEIHAFFAVTPSRVLMAEAIRKGKVHVEIHPSPAFLRGDLVTGGETVVTGEGGAELVVPAGAVTEALAAFVEGLDPATLDPAPTGMSLVGAAEVDLAGQSLEVGATLSVLAPEGLSPENLFAARVLTVSGQRKLNFLGPASLDGGRLSTAGIFSGGTYLFFQSSEPLALVQGTVREGGLPARLAVVESSTAPFSDVTGDSGVYLVAAALRETQVTARSVSSGNTGSASITPSTPDPLTLDIVLTATGPFVTGVVPKDGSRGVPLASVVTLEFSERVEPSTLTQDSFSLRVAGGEVLEGRITLGANKRSASFLPSKNLDPVTVYQISATGAITDASGNGLLPFTSSFTTKDITVAGFNPDAVTISFPNEEGEVTVWAPAGSFESGASILIINNTNGIVTSGMVLSDGSFSIELRAAITDEIQIRIRDSSNREVVIEKTEFHAPDGRVAIGKKGGKISEGEFVLEVPEGALSEAAIFKLLSMAQELIDQLPLPEGAGGKGAAVEIDTGGVTLEREAKLFFPTVPDAPEGADFLVVRKIVENDLTLYEAIDSASPKEGKITTDSFPFPGILEPGFYLSLWYPTVPSTGKSPLGVITGIARETDANPAGPTTVPLKDVTVRVEKVPVDGDFTATTGVDGRFTLWDLNFGGTIELFALDSKGREARAIAFEDPTLLGQFPNLARYGRVGEVVLNFPLSPPPPPPSSIELRLFREEEGEEKEITNGFVTTGEKLILRVFFTDSPGRASLDVNGLPVSLENIDGLSYQGFFTPSEARGYTVVVTAVDAFLRPLTVTKSFLAVPAGSGNDEPLPGPPSVISDSAVPRPGETGVPLAQISSVQFTEPVKNVSTGSVILRKEGSTTEIPIELIGSGPGGVGPVTPSSEIWSLTIRPRRGLEFASPYELVFTGDIIDTDTPTASSLSPDPTLIDFTTFSPASLGETEVTEAMGIAVVKNRVFVARNTFSASVRGFDISDPVHPERIPDVSQDTVLFGIMPQITSEEDVHMGFGETDLIGTLTTNIFSGQGILEVFDVGGKNSPFSWTAVVTTNSGAPGTYAADVALFKGFAYVAVGEGGIEVIDLEKAADLLRTTPSHEVTQSLSTKGAGFAQSAILNTIPIEFNGETLSAGAVAVDDTSLGRVAFVGSWGYLSSVDVSAFVPQPILKTTPLEIAINESETLSMGFVREIGLTSIEGRDLAVLVGGPASGRTRGTLGIVDVTDPANPTVLTIMELQGGSATSLAFDEDASTVYIGTAEAVEAYNLTDPNHPQLAGTIEASGDVAITPNQILVTASQAVGLTLHRVFASQDDLEDPPPSPSAEPAPPPPKPTDTVFVIDEAPQLDTECRFSSSGPIVFEIPVTRHVGALDPATHTLKDAAILKYWGAISEHATLKLIVYDVDSGVGTLPSEVDRVLFNGEEVGALYGLDKKWQETTLEIPIEKVRFAERGRLGSAPQPAMNEVSIEVNSGEATLQGVQWCTAVGWASLEFKAMSPVILIHGNNSDGGFFVRNGFTTLLESRNLSFDNSISMVPNAASIEENATTLNRILTEVTRTFSTDSIHLVAHSKGGLDVRAYLADFHPRHEKEFTVLSYTSLSTPHNGSVLADIQVLREVGAGVASRVEFVDFPSFTALLSWLAGVDRGTWDLTTWWANVFNDTNLPRLPESVVYNVVAADLDQNGSGGIDVREEYAALLNDNSWLRQLDQVDQDLGTTLTLGALDKPYQILRTTSRVDYNTRVETVVVTGPEGEKYEMDKRIATIRRIRSSRDIGNDVLVAIPSGVGQGSFDSRVSDCMILVGENGKVLAEGAPSQCLVFEGEGRNHSSIADYGVAFRVMEWILKVEKSRGDLRP